MYKSKLILFSDELPRCCCYNNILKSSFDCFLMRVNEDFRDLVQNLPLDAAIICFCSTQSQKDQVLSRAHFLAGVLPVIACTKNLNPDFMRQAFQNGIEQFFTCDTQAVRIGSIINDTIHRGGLMKVLKICCPGYLVVSPNTRKMAEEILHAFPCRLSLLDMAERLGKSRSWVQKFCKRQFGLTYIRLLRRIRVCQALWMMQHSALDNGEIALHLGYTEESNLARDFRKELRLCPTDARQHLLQCRIEDLIQ